ncbi:MAG: hypothetical protein FWF58_02950, partial [Firmicutes bacterium]|nr:hypothetical protein [Bacillota bacterium]
LIDSTNLEQNLQVKFVSLKSIWNIGDILLIKNQNDIKYSWNTLNPKLNFPLHAKVYCQSGFYHGDVIDFELKNYKISQLHTTNNIANYNILSISKDIIIINTTNKNIVLNKKKRISQKIALPNVVELDTKL